MLSLDGRAGLGRGGLAHVGWWLVAQEQSGCRRGVCRAARLPLCGSLTQLSH